MSDNNENFNQKTEAPQPQVESQALNEVNNSRFTNNATDAGKAQFDQIKNESSQMQQNGSLPNFEIGNTDSGKQGKESSNSDANHHAKDAQGAKSATSMSGDSDGPNGKDSNHVDAQKSEGAEANKSNEKESARSDANTAQGKESGNSDATTQNGKDSSSSDANKSKEKEGGSPAGASKADPAKAENEAKTRSIGVSESQNSSANAYKLPALDLFQSTAETSKTKPSSSRFPANNPPVN